MPNPHCSNRVFALLALVSIMVWAVGGCSDDSDAPSAPLAPAPVGNIDTEAPVQAPCLGLTVVEPVEGEVLATSRVRVAGMTGSDEAFTVTVNDVEFVAEGGAFETVLEAPDGDLRVEVRCHDQREVRNVRVVTVSPKIIVDTPMSGALIVLGTEAIKVAGRIENPQAAASATMNGMPLSLNDEGRFRANYIPQAGMNHLDFEVATYGDEVLDLRRSFLYGRFADWDATDGATATANVQRSAFEKAAQAMENLLTPEYVQALLTEEIDEDEDLQVHEILYERLEVDFEPLDGRLGVRLQLHDLAVRLTYEYELLGTDAQLSGWARSRPADVRAEVVIVPTDDGSYDLVVQRPSVELHDFELDLDDFYEAAEDIVEAAVSDIAREALLDALRDIAIEDLLAVNILDLEIELFGRRTALNLTIDDLRVTPEGIHASTSASVEALEAVHDAIGYWNQGIMSPGMPGNHDLSLGLSVDIFNRLLGEAWRGGAMDLDLGSLIGGGDTITVALLAGTAGEGLLQNFSAAAEVQLATRARMQAIMELTDPVMGQLAIRFGALELTMSTEDEAGELRHWATVEVTLDFTMNPGFADGEFFVDSSLHTRVEVVDSPLFPLNEAAFENFLENALSGLAAPALNDLVNDAFNFGQLDILGLGVESVQYGDAGAGPGVLVMGIDLAVNPP